MSKRQSIVTRRRAPIGTPPGTLVPDDHASTTRLRLVTITDDKARIHDDPDLGALRKAIASGNRLWLDVAGFADHELLEEIAQLFEIPALALEDIINTNQRPKVDQYDRLALVFLHMFPGASAHSKEQIAISFHDRHLITFQERSGDCLAPVLRRLAAPQGRMRAGSPGYLAYALIDTIIDAYFPLLERIGSELEELEDRVIEDAVPSQVATLHALKRELLVIKRGVWPTRELLSILLREDFPNLPETLRPYLRDTYDHAVQLIDIVETYRELGSGVLDLYLTSVSTRMNEIMKVLTIVATIFIPLTFLAGIWGMNFDSDTSPWNMPELASYFGYPAALLSMLAIGIAMLAYFRWKKWL